MELGTTGEGERAQPGDSTPRSHTGTTGEEAWEREGEGGVRTGAPEGELSSVLLPTSLPQSALPPPVLPGVHGDTLTPPPPPPGGRHGETRPSSGRPVNHTTNTPPIREDYGAVTVPKG